VAAAAGRPARFFFNFFFPPSHSIFCLFVLVAGGCVLFSWAFPFRRRTRRRFPASRDPGTRPAGVEGLGTPGLGPRESRVSGPRDSAPRESRVSGPRDSAPRESPASRESRARLLLLNPSTLPWARVPRAASRGLVVRGQVGVQLPTRPFCVRVTGAAWANGERKTKNKKENKGKKKKEQGERSKNWMQHRDFPGGHPSQYYSGPKALNFRVLMGSGVVALV
jgi:hypothetical protein